MTSITQDYPQGKRNMAGRAKDGKTHQTTSNTNANPVRRVYLIGAGMSKECGAPTLGEFLSPQYLKLARKTDVELAKKFIRSAYPKGAEPNIEDVLSFVDHAMEQREPVMDFGTEDLREVRAAVVNVITEILMKNQENLDHVFGVDDTYKPYSALNADQGRGRLILETKLVCELTAEMGRFLGEVNTVENRSASSKEAKGWSETYSRLVAALNDGDTIITMNYDLFLDIAVASMSEKFGHTDDGSSFNVTYGVDIQKISSDGDVACNGILDFRSKEEYLFRGPSVTFLKLHGSLNWAICSSCKTLLTTDWTPVSRISTYINRLQSADVDFKSRHLCCPRFTLEPLIVAPTWMKDYDNPILRDLWQTAVTRLHQADEVVFMGYSFSEADFQLRYLFSRALHMRYGRPWRCITVVNPDQSVVDRYRRFFGNITYKKMRVSEFLRGVPINIPHKRRNKVVTL